MPQPRKLNPEDLKAAQAWLTRKGYRTVTVANATEALSSPDWMELTTQYGRHATRRRR